MHVLMHLFPEPIYVCIYEHGTLYYIAQYIAKFALKKKKKILNVEECHIE